MKNAAALIAAAIFWQERRMTAQLNVRSFIFQP